MFCQGKVMRTNEVATIADTLITIETLLLSIFPLSFTSFEVFCLYFFLSSLFVPFSAVLLVFSSCYIFTLHIFPSFLSSFSFRHEVNQSYHYSCYPYPFSFLKEFILFII